MTLPYVRIRIPSEQIQINWKTVLLTHDGANTIKACKVKWAKRKVDARELAKWVRVLIELVKV